MILGSSVAFLCALAWAGSSTILKLLTAKIDTLSINTVRLWVGSLLILGFVALSGRGAEFLDSPLGPLVYVIASGILAMAIGDSIYIKSLSLLDASIAFPSSICFRYITNFNGIAFHHNILKLFFVNINIFV